MASNAQGTTPPRPGSVVRVDGYGDSKGRIELPMLVLSVEGLLRRVDPDAAEDIAHEALLSLRDKLDAEWGEEAGDVILRPRRGGIENPKSYTFRAARNLALRRIDEAGRQQAVDPAGATLDRRVLDGRKAAISAVVASRVDEALAELERRHPHYAKAIQLERVTHEQPTELRLWADEHREENLRDWRHKGRQWLVRHFGPLIRSLGALASLLIGRQRSQAMALLGAASVAVLLLVTMPPDSSPKSTRRGSVPAPVPSLPPALPAGAQAIAINPSGAPVSSASPSQSDSTTSVASQPTETGEGEVTDASLTLVPAPAVDVLGDRFGDDIAHVATSRDGRWVAASGDDDNSVQIIDARSGRVALRLPTGNDARQAEFTADGGSLWVCSADMRIRRHTLPGGTLSLEISTPDFPHRLRLSPGGGFVAASTWKEGIHVWEAAAGQPADAIDAGDAYVALEWIGEGQLATVTAGQLLVRDVIGRRDLLRVPLAIEGPANDLAIDPRGVFAVIAGSDLLVAPLATDGGEASALGVGTVLDVEVSPDGGHIIACRVDGAVSVISTHSWERIEYLPPASPVTAAISPDSAKVALALADHSIDVRELATGRLLARWEGVAAERLLAPLTGQPPIAFSPSEGTFITGGPDGVVRRFSLP